MRNSVYPQIKENAGCYELITGYDAGFVAELKAMIPASDRKFDMSKKSWLVSAQYGKNVAGLIERYFGILPTLPILSQPSEIETNVLKILYLGSCKERQDGFFATGYTEEGWNTLFSEQILRDWFGEGTKNPSGNYFTILGLKTGSSDEEIKAGYRRMVKQWHPDVNHEPGAQEAFLKIQAAYDVLKDAQKRAKYEAGLIFEASLNQFQKKEVNHGYRAPLKNGLILAQYEKKMGWNFVREIKSWNDIYNDQGQTLTSSWIMGEKEPRLEWI